MPKYRKKNAVCEVIVEAEQWFPGMTLEGVTVLPSGSWARDYKNNARKLMPGDWIVTNSKGVKNRCLKKDFEMRYELLEE